MWASLSNVVNSIAPMAEVFASLGSNQNRVHNIRSAVRVLEQQFGPLRRSPVYLSKTIGFEGDDFLNMVVSFHSGLSPQEVQRIFHQIENEHGRERGGAKFSSRQLDIDLILYDDLVLTEATLKLPREDIERYAFVLRPLADLQPGGIHPRLRKSYAQMWREHETDEGLQPFDMQFTN